MDTTHYIYTRDLDELNEAFNLLARADSKCLDCRSTSELTCPSCDTGESCGYTVPLDCSECPTAQCVPDSDSDGSSGSSDGGGGGGGPNVGAIAGGVIGGVIVIAIAIYLVWRFLIKPKRSDESMRRSAYTVGYDPSQDTEKDGQSRITRRSSTHTVHSIASTVLTRASNIIQIAYIPGVTNRANPSNSDVLVPPVPAIPMEHGGTGVQRAELGTGNEDQHFFMPADLRDSTYSGLSGYSDRTSYATRTSYAPRSSIASTIYGKQAQVMTPASTGLRAKPTMVSVRSAGSSGSTPPVPNIDFEKFGNSRPKSGASTFSVGSTFLNTATQARAQVVKVGGLKQVEIPAKSDTNSSKSLEATSRPVNRANISELDGSPVTATPSLAVNDSPFNDPPETPSTLGLRSVSTPGLGSVMEADSEDEHVERSGKLSAPERGHSPFGDEHATK